MRVHYSKNDLKTLRSQFQKYDIIGDGEIEIDELIKALKIKYSKFTHEIFLIIDRKDKGSINFHHVSFYKRVLVSKWK